jgi:hypothetical protein
MKSYKLFLLLITAVTLSLPIASASIIYSGIRDITLAGQADSNQSLTINIEGKNGDVSDDLTLAIFLSGTASIGSNFAGAASGVVLAASGQVFPSVINLGLSDPFPVNAIFGSGSFLLWDFQNPGTADSIDVGQFKDTTGYAAMLINSNQDVSQQTYGWVQLAADNSKSLSSPFPTITVIDWAYSDTPGELLLMGQKSSVPEGGASVVGLIALAGTCWLGGKRWRFTPKSSLC